MIFEKEVTWTKQKKKKKEFFEIKIDISARVIFNIYRRLFWLLCVSWAILYLKNIFCIIKISVIFEHLMILTDLNFKLRTQNNLLTEFKEFIQRIRITSICLWTQLLQSEHKNAPRLLCYSFVMDEWLKDHFITSLRSIL